MVLEAKAINGIGWDVSYSLLVLIKAKKLYFGVLAWLSGARCIFAYGPSDATHSLSLAPVNPDWFYLSHINSPWLIADKGPLNGCRCMRGSLYSSCVRSSMLHRGDTWPVRKENEVALQQAKMRMVRWMCGIKVKDRVLNKELIERLGLDDIISVLEQNRLRWYRHVLQKEDNDWVKK